MRVTVEEAREILGEKAVQMSDEEIQNIIGTLEILAKEALKLAKEKQSIKGHE